MANLPTNRSTSNTEEQHVNDHNELHTVHNQLQDLSGLADVGTIASGDLVLIEDISDSNTRKRTTAQDIADLGVGGTDGTAIHDDTAGEISAITTVPTLAGGDYVLIEDVSDSNNKKKTTAQDIADLADVDERDTLSMWITTTTTLGWQHGDIMVNPSSGSIVISLPSQATFSGMSVFIQRWGTLNTVTVDLDVGTDDMYDEQGASVTQVTLDSAMSAIAIRSLGDGWYTAAVHGTVTWT